MVINAGSREPGDGFWRAGYREPRYREALNLSPDRKRRWLSIQQAWCVAKARDIVNPIDLRAIDAESEARDAAETALIDLMLEENDTASG